MGISNARVLTFRFRRLHLFRSSRNLLPRPGAKLIIFVLTVLLLLHVLFVLCSLVLLVLHQKVNGCVPEDDKTSEGDEER